MRAVSFSSFGGPEVLEVIDATVPDPSAGQIRIAVRGCGVNPFDWKQRRGMFGGTPPIRVGVEVAGTVDAIGPDAARGIALGDPVYGFAIGGGAAEFTLAEHYAPIPPDLDFEAAASMPVAVETAYRVLELLDLPPGSCVLVNGGSGAVGQALVQLACARGTEVLATAAEANHALVEDLGARAVTYGPGLADRVRALGVSGIDGAVDAGGGGVLADLVRLTGDPQRVVTIVPDPAVEGLGVRISGGNSAFYGLRDIATVITAGGYRPPATAAYPLEKAADAQQRSETGHPGATKLLLAP